MAQLSKCLPHKHEDLSLDPRTHIKVGCMPVTPVLEGERHRERSLELAGQSASPGSMRHPVSK